jgi:hypothetical protein
MFWIAIVIVVAAFVLAGVAYWQFWNATRGGRRTKRQSFAAPVPLTPLEMAVLREHVKQLPRKDSAALAEQIDAISVRSRENTGAGFFTYFVFKSPPLHKVKTDMKKCHVTATINDLSNALGFILWVKDGYVDCLEGYTLAMDSTADLDLAMAEFELSASRLSH